MSDSNQGGNFMPKEELAASGSGHLLLTDFDDDEKEDVEDSMVEFANQQGNSISYFHVLKREILIFTKLEDFWPPSTSYLCTRIHTNNKNLPRNTSTTKCEPCKTIHTSPHNFASEISYFILERIGYIPTYTIMNDIPCYLSL